MMDKEELKEYLRNNLSVEIETHNNGLYVTLLLDGEVISESSTRIG
jgi:hypothetical protein